MTIYILAALFLLADVVLYRRLMRANRLLDLSRRAVRLWRDEATMRAAK